MKGDQQDILGRTLYGETRGEGKAGMEAVACVVLNRCAIAKAWCAAHIRPHPLFGDGTPARACLKTGQFSCWNTNDPNYVVLENLDADNPNPAFAACLEVAGDAIAGNIVDPTGGATHYKVIGTPAAWARGLTPCFTLGHHEFYTNVP